MREKIKDKILSFGTVREFAEKHQIRLATLYDFLNGKANIHTDNLEKIMLATGLVLDSSAPFKVASAVEVTINGKDIAEGDQVRLVNHIILKDGGFTHVVHSCFSSESSTYQGVILQNMVSSELELIIYEKK